jgi:hypothetical protein
MGLFSRLLNARSSQTTTVSAALLKGNCLVAAVGEANYQPALQSLCGSRRWEDVRYECVAALVPEPTNRYDPNAVMVQCDGHHVGYLSRGDALDYRPAIQAFARQGRVIACNAMIAGRGPGSDTPNLGIFLTLPKPSTALREAA